MSAYFDRPPYQPKERQVRNRPTALLGVLLALALFAAACGDDDDGGGEGADEEDSAEELTPITVGIIPVAGLAPLYYGVEQGFFQDEGLDVSMKVGEGGAAMTPAVLEGEYQFAIGEYISLMLARQNNVGLQVVSNLVNGADTPDEGTVGLLVAPDSGIDSIDDLAGKAFGVNNLEGLDEVAVRAILDEHGVDDSGISFIEVPYPEMNATLQAGDVDVVSQPEPFVTLGEQDGLVNFLDPLYEALPSMPLGLVFGSEEWLDENPELANAFYRALQRSIEAASDEEAMRDAIVDNTEIPPDVVEEMPLDNWQAEADREALAVLGQLATRYGVLEEAPNLDELIWTPD
jgi:NitT/TauT family transport system substrate-binding protein